MPQICFDESRFSFPSVNVADEEGLVLIGGRVTPQRVIEAYKQGIFPWYNDDALPLWWSPDPRFVLFPHQLHVSRSMKKTIAKGEFHFQVNTAFEDVIQHCANVERKDQDGTWITPQMQKIYTQLFYDGYAHSAEAWKDNKLVGGMYGLRIGNVFFGESMFSTESNASKFAFIQYVQTLVQEGVTLMDCQVYTEHVESLGGRLIERKTYLELLSRHCNTVNNHKIEN